MMNDVWAQDGALHWGGGQTLSQAQRSIYPFWPLDEPEETVGNNAQCLWGWRANKERGWHNISATGPDALRLFSAVL